MRTLLLLGTALGLLSSAHAAMLLPSSAPALPDPPGITSTVSVSTTAQLVSAIAGLVSNQKIVIQPGTYMLSSQLYMAGPVDNVVIRGATGNPTDVVIQGAGMSAPGVPFVFEVASCTNALFADLSAGFVYYSAFQLHGESGCQAVRIYNCRIFDTGEQLIKGNPLSSGNGVN